MSHTARCIWRNGPGELTTAILGFALDLPVRVTSVVLGLCVSLVGTVLTVFPFATAETVGVLGLSRACGLVRFLGMVLAGGGIVFAGFVD